jgi:hypothetical protein
MLSHLTFSLLRVSVSLLAQPTTPQRANQKPYRHGTDAPRHYPHTLIKFKIKICSSLERQTDRRNRNVNNSTNIERKNTGRRTPHERTGTTISCRFRTKSASQGLQPNKALLLVFSRTTLYVQDNQKQTLNGTTRRYDDGISCRSSCQ